MNNSSLEQLDSDVCQWFIQTRSQGVQINVKYFWKRYTIKDSVFNFAQAWNDLPHVTQIRASNKLWPQENNEDNNNAQET